MKFEVVTSVVVKRLLVCALGLGLVVALAPMSVTAGSVFGTVQVNGPVWSSTGAADWSEVSATRPLVAGDKYRTGDEGYLLADLGEQGVVGMYGNTEITAGAAGAGALIDVLKGKVAFHLAPESALQLKAANAAINVDSAGLDKAADGYVEVNKAGSAVLAVEEGTINVRVAGVDRTLTQGQQIQLSGDKPMRLAGSDSEDAAAAAVVGGAAGGGAATIGGVAIGTAASIAAVAAAVAIVVETDDDASPGS